MSTASHLCQRREVSLCFAAQILHSQSTASVKKAGTGWEHWISQITDHLKPPTVAKRCTFRESRKSPALRGFVAGRWALATTSLYPSTKIERPQRAQNRGPRRRSFSGTEWPRWSGLPRHDCPGQPPPHTRPNAAEIPVSVAPPSPPPRNRHTGAARPRQGSSCGRLPLPGEWVRATPAKAPGGRLRQARCSACLTMPRHSPG